MKRDPYLEVRDSANDPTTDHLRYWYVLVGGNRQVMLTSNPRPRRSSVMRAAKRFQKMLSLRVSDWSHRPIEIMVRK